MKTFLTLLFLWIPCWVFGQIQLYEYWFDHQYAHKVTQTVSATNQLQMNSLIQTTGLTPGVHSYSIHFKDIHNHWSSVLTQFFYKVPESFSVQNPTITEYEYWFDSDYVNKVSQQVTSEETFVLIDNMESVILTHGAHSFSIRFKDANNDWSSVLTQFFYKMPDSYLINNPEIKAFEYWFNSDYENRVNQDLEPQTLFILDEVFDASALPNSVHTISLRFQDENEEWSSIITQFFYKQEGDWVTLREITAYQYWFNDDGDNAIIVNITPAENFELNTFVIPEEYALGLGTHSFHIRFLDNAGLWSSILSSEFNINTLDLPEHTLKEVIVYPNPTRGNLIINFPQVWEEVSIRLYDLNGRLVQEQKVERVDYAELQLRDAAGFYILVIENEGKQSIHKILKR